MHLERFNRLISEEIGRISGIDQRSLLGSCGGNYKISIVIDSGENCFKSGEDVDGILWRCGSIVSSDLISDDEAVDELLEKVLEKEISGSSAVGGRIYTIVVGSYANGDSRVVVGKHRHAWITGNNFSESQTILMLGNIFVKLFMNGGMMMEISQGKGDVMPVGSDGSVVLSFSLLNANPIDWVYDW